MKSVNTEIFIDAPPEKVWEIFTDFANYSRWSVFMQSVIGKAAKGERIVIEVAPKGGKPMKFNPLILSCIPQQELIWEGRLWNMPGLFTGRHSFLLQKENQGTRFIQKEQWNGLLLPLIWPMLKDSMQPSFEAFNESLKKACEA